jgi:hypothetical protein
MSNDLAKEGTAYGEKKTITKDKSHDIDFRPRGRHNVQTENDLPPTSALVW